MQNDLRARIRAEAERLSAAFRAAGATQVEAACLQPADILLDLYGEDIRARAYVTHDPVLGEQMLRPDFTVPVVQMHMTEGAEPARYTYSGPVWRKQDADSTRASEYLQVGFELFDRANPAASDAEVFALFSGALAPVGLHPATGDLGILKAAVDGLSTLETRKAALRRHIWRPARFRQLLDRYAGLTPPPESRQKLLAEANETNTADLIDRSGVFVGLRSVDEIRRRISALHDDAAAPPLARAEVDILGRILAIKATSTSALAELRRIAGDFPAIGPAVDRMEARLNALSRANIDVNTLDFEGSYGRTTLEYYDGFVFGFYAEGRPDLPPVASGGRYDALTGVLGQGKGIPAVGGVIRPELILALSEEA